MPNVVTALLSRPEAPSRYGEWAELPVAGLVEEAMRLSSPPNHFLRYACHDAQVGGARIQAGQAVAVWFGSANRDEAVFDQPDTFRPGRSPNRHIAWAPVPTTARAPACQDHPAGVVRRAVRSRPGDRARRSSRASALQPGGGNHRAADPDPAALNHSPVAEARRTLVAATPSGGAQWQACGDPWARTGRAASHAAPHRRGPGSGAIPVGYGTLPSSPSSATASAC